MIQALQHCTTAIDEASGLNSDFVKFPCLVGLPGAGKTYILVFFLKVMFVL